MTISVASLILFGSALAASAFEWSAGGRAESVGASPIGAAAVPSVDPQLTYWKHHAQRYRKRWLYALKKRDQWKAYAKRLRAKTRRRVLGASTSSPAAVQRTIRAVFGAYGDEAVAVSDCETGGTFSIWATNGQYVNIFQMGYAERKKYGWHVAGSPAIVAARAAYRYFVDSGRDWSPWECKP